MIYKQKNTLKLQSDQWQRYVVFLAILVAWYITSKFVPPLFVPGPKLMVESLIQLGPELPLAIFTSMTMIVSGFLIGSFMGILFSMLLAYSKLFLNLFEPVFNFIRPVPVFALIPLFVLWFGIGATPQIALIAFGCFITLSITTFEVIRNIPSIYIQASYTLGANRQDVFRTIIVPYIIPHLVGAIRLSATLSFGLCVAAEFMGSQSGLGYLMIVQQQYLQTDGILLIVIIFSILAWLLDKIIAGIEKRITEWTEREDSQEVLIG